MAIWGLVVWTLSVMSGAAKIVAEEVLRDLVVAPYALGPATDIDGVWELQNGSGLQEGYVIQSESLAPLPGFSGAAINLMIVLDLDGSFIDVRLLDHNEPIFVSGLGEAPFRAFLEQYRGQSINTPMTVGSNYGAQGGGGLVYLDGVTKATASVRIAHETIIAAARDVARQKLGGLVGPQSSAVPKEGYMPQLTWADMVEDGIAKHITVPHRTVRTLYEGTIWADDDPFADRSADDLYLDLWIVDITPPAIAATVMQPRMQKEVDRLRAIAPQDELILLIEAGDHGLVSEEFVRNTAPDWLLARQDGLPIGLRDGDVLIDLVDGLPEGAAMVLRIDRRLGFNPVEPWELGLLALREHGMFQPEIGQMEVTATYAAPRAFFDVTEPPKPLSPFAAALVARQGDLIALAMLLGLTGFAMAAFAWWRRAVPLAVARPVILVLVLGFVGWWGQGQLSIVTAMATLRAVLDGKSLAFLLYDPFSLLIWAVTLVSFFLWGRALFCGWLCPFGALQEGVQKLAAWARIPQWRVSPAWDRRLSMGKYLALAGLVGVTLWAPQHLDKAAEVEPFKTAISVFFVREWYYVAYALIALGLSAVVAKAYCRYLCPLGALMALGGMVQLRPWIARRSACGNPCQLCKNRCAYGSIAPSGAVRYSECLGCLDCVDIYADDTKCVPLILAAKGKKGAL